MRVTAPGRGLSSTFMRRGRCGSVFAAYHKFTSVRCVPIVAAELLVLSVS
jgi:hypothetical protein